MSNRLKLFSLGISIVIGASGAEFAFAQPPTKPNDQAKGDAKSATQGAPSRGSKSADSNSGDSKAKSAPNPDDPYAGPRERMIKKSLIDRGIKNPRVIEAFRTVPRHKYFPPDSFRLAYEDESAPIGQGQTITAPFEVAYMTEILDPQPTDKIYEVGTGSGFQASILSRLAKEVYSVEIKEPLGKRAAQVIKELGYNNIKTRIGDGYEGWPEAAPFDAIIVTCSPSKIPQPLIDQLKEGGRMIIPIGTRHEQELIYLVKKNGKMLAKPLRGTLFVPMTGRALEEAERARGGAKPKAKTKSKPRIAPSEKDEAKAKKSASGEDES